MPGITLLKVPGHTPGMQAVVITTERGKVALVSDCGDNYANWYPADPIANPRPLRFLGQDFLPGAIRSEGERTYGDSMRRVLANADIVIPARDPRIATRVPEQWFAKPSAESHA